MSMRFNGAQEIKTVGLPGTFSGARPFSVGFWAYADATGVAEHFFTLADETVNNQYFGVRKTAANAWGICAAAGGAENQATAGTVTAKKWVYIVARFITATNDRLSVLQADGTIVHAQRTTSLSPTADQFRFGVRQILASDEHLAGYMQEIWFAPVDIQIGGGVMPNDTLRQMAYYGPWSLPRMSSVIELYLSLRLGGPGWPPPTGGGIGAPESFQQNDSFWRTYPPNWPLLWANSSLNDIGPPPPYLSPFEIKQQPLGRRFLMI